MITLRIDPDLEQSITLFAKTLGISKSELVRKSILEYMNKKEFPNPWETGKDLFGKYSSGCGNLSSKRKEWVKEKIRAKRE